MIKVIIAVDPSGGIGYQGDMLFKDSIDLMRFKQLTLHQTILMGSKTYQSIPYPLSGRKEIVLTSNPSSLNVDKEPYSYIDDIKQVDDLIKNNNSTIWFIGGSTLLNSLPIEYCQFIEEYHITYFRESKKADAILSPSIYFPYDTHYIHFAQSYSTKHPHTYIIWKKKD